MTRDGNRILADLKRHGQAFNLEAPVGRQTLGGALCATFTDGVAATLKAEQDPSGNRWPDLSPAYEADKSRRFPGKPMGERLGVMVDPVEVAGDVIPWGPDAVSVTYGLSDEARDEAAYFQEGDAAQNRPPRRFWGFTAASSAATVQLLDDRFRKILR